MDDPSQLLYHIPSLFMNFLRRCSQSDLSCSLARATLQAPSTGWNQVHLSTLDTTPSLHQGGRNLHWIPYEIFTFSSRQDSIIATKSEPDRGGLLSPSHLTPSKPGATPPCLKLHVHTNHWWSLIILVRENLISIVRLKRKEPNWWQNRWQWFPGKDIDDSWGWCDHDSDGWW